MGNESQNWLKRRQSLLGRSFAAVTLLGLLTTLAVAQAVPTAERRLNVQVGGMFSLANPGIPKDDSIYYGKWNYNGGGVYATFDPPTHYGVELGVRQIFGDFVHERTLQVGPRYYKTFGRYVPYGKVMIGRGFFTFPNNIGSSSFNEIAFGGGVDYRLSPAIHVRADYEYQRWLGFANKVQGFPGALSPQVFSVGFAYHIR
jgi:opacity protein-like surface antigen